MKIWRLSRGFLSRPNRDRLDQAMRRRTDIPQLAEAFDQAETKLERTALAKEIDYQLKIQSQSNPVLRAKIADCLDEPNQLAYRRLLLLLLCGIWAYEWEFRDIADVIKHPERLIREVKKGRPGKQAGFSSVKGIDEFREELQDLVDIIKNPEKYREIGARIHKGILLVGPPGCGKTLLARAIASEAGVNFISKGGSEFSNMYVGMGAKEVRKLFEQARKEPTIIFIDQIDSLAGKRSVQGSQGGQTINQLLAEMDGFRPTDKIVVIGATNMEDALDPAIKRPGRFDKTIYLPLPDIKGREQIFQQYIGRIRTDPVSVSAKELAKRTTGFSGADIRNICNLSILRAIREGKQWAAAEEFEYAIDRVKMGISRNMLLEDQQKRKVAIHEAGQALTALLTPGADSLHKVTILPRGPRLGMTAFTNENEVSRNKQQYLANLDVAMGGRAAEELLLGSDEVSTVCWEDQKRATRLAYNYYKFMGMDEGLTLLTQREVTASAQFNYRVDKKVQLALRQSHDRVKALLKRESTRLRQLVKLLLDKETISGDEAKALLHLN